MTIAVWAVSAILALAYLGAGLNKAFRSKPWLEKTMTYTEDFTHAQVKVIGVIEIVGAIGLIVPALTGIAPILSAFAAVGLAIVQVVAFVVHVRRHETARALPINGGLFAAAVFVAVGRFLGY